MQTDMNYSAILKTKQNAHQKAHKSWQLAKEVSRHWLQGFSSWNWSCLVGAEQ